MCRCEGIELPALMKERITSGEEMIVDFHDNVTVMAFDLADLLGSAERAASSEHFLKVLFCLCCCCCCFVALFLRALLCCFTLGSTRPTLTWSCTTPGHEPSVGYLRCRREGGGCYARDRRHLPLCHSRIAGDRKCFELFCAAKPSLTSPEGVPCPLFC